MTELVDYLGNRHAVEVLRFIGSEGTTQAKEIRIFTEAGNNVTTTCTELQMLGLITTGKCDLDVRLVFYSITEKGQRVIDLLNQINDILEEKA